MLKIGIVGTGWFSQVHADLLAKREGVQITAVCGTSQEKADAMASRLQDARGFASFRDMLDAGPLHAVYLCVPPMAHGEMEEELAARGIPFLVEKPLGLDIETPRHILAKVEQAGLLTSVGYHFRYKETVSHLKQLLEGRTIGMAIGQWMGSMPMVPWWRRQEGSGGQFIEQTTHIVDLLRYCGGEVSEVYASYAQRVMAERVPGVEVPDVGTVVLKLASGAVASLSNTCLLPEDASRVGLTFYTDDGILDWTPETLTRTGRGHNLRHEHSGNPYEAETDAFLHALRTGDASRIRSTYADAFRTQQVTAAALQSANSGLPVRLTSSNLSS